MASQFEREMQQMSDDVVGFLGKSGGITLRRVTPGAVDTATQKRAVTTIDAALAATVSANRPIFLTSGGGKLQVFERDFLVKVSDLEASAFGTNEPKAGDIVILGGVQLGVDRVVKEAQETLYKITTRESK